MKKLILICPVVLLLWVVTPSGQAQLNFLPGSDDRQVNLSCTLPTSLDPPENDFVQVAGVPPAPFADWQTNLIVDYSITFDVDLTVYATASQDSELSGQRIHADLYAHAFSGYGTASAPAGYAEAHTEFEVRFQVAAPTPFQVVFSTPSPDGGQGFALYSDVSGSLVESDYPFDAWLDYSGVLMPGEVYTLQAGAQCSTFNADPGIVGIELWVIPEPVAFSLLGLGSLMVVLVRRHRS